MTEVQRRAVRGTAMVAGMVLATALTGCQNFFVCNKASCTSNPSTPSEPAGDVVYVANNVLATTNISGYTLGTKLTATTSSPYGVTLIPSAMVVSRNNNFLYVASAVTTAAPVAGIYGFTIGTGGVLTRLNSGNALASLTSVAAMDVSPDGNWLIAATANDGLNANTITAYPLNTTTGLTTGTPIVLSNLTLPANSAVSALKVAPSGQFISLAVGLGGVEVCQFLTATGQIGTGSYLPFTNGGAYDVAIDSNNYLYIAVTGKIFVYGVSSTGAPNANPVTAAGIVTEAGGPFSIALDGTSYLYAGASDGATTPTYSIYAFSIKSGVLTALSPQTITAPASTTKIGVDSTGAYLLAAGYDSTAGLKLYSITSATGALTALDTAATGPTLAIPTALALSH